MMPAWPAIGECVEQEPRHPAILGLHNSGASASAVEVVRAIADAITQLDRSLNGQAVGFIGTQESETRRLRCRLVAIPDSARCLCRYGLGVHRTGTHSHSSRRDGAEPR